ncbi:unnamed protein product [Clonostachys rosea]|uniref:CBM1 domain-containing protein n=1 Tax=Bionectria ochroleuca TaxID=29856 RepID=A0ABY6UJM0_BIOOC|nr:unnamed protein product [Clonostachys rosea]
MRASLVSSLLSLSSLSLALDVSDSRDADLAHWPAVEDGAVSARSNELWNRPIKRQSGWSPPSNLATPLKQVWDHCLNTYSNGLFGFKNYGWDQIIATGGKINVCVRWESSASVTEAQRTQIATVVNQQYQKWFQWLYGYDSFPYSNIQVNVVGWAVRDRSLLQGSTSGITVYTDKDSGGAPQCSEACGRFFHQDGNYNSCPGGAANHYDQSLWLTDGFGGGAGGDWGQRIGREYFMGALTSSNIHILLHEMGHTFGLDDFYDWTPSGVSSFIMLAGSASQITDFDGWMLRNWWYELSRNRGWRSGGSTPTSTSTSTAANPTSTSGGTAPAFGQCGGQGWTGPTACASGYKCQYSNEWYSQCVPA